MALATFLAACGTIAPPAPSVAVDVPAAPEPSAPEVAAVPAPPVVTEPARPRWLREPGDALPRVEPIASGGPNRPYAIRGERFVPENNDVPMSEIGIASWYGEPFHGRPSSTGERYDMNAMTAAHPTMPLPSYARVKNLSNGREVIVRVNDRGPFHGGRVIDLSRAAARKLGFGGLALVEVVRLTHDDIRSGAWKERASTTPTLAGRPAAPASRHARGRSTVQALASR